MRDKLIQWAVWAAAVVGSIAVVVWITWPVWHKDVGKETVAATNSIVTKVEEKTAVAVTEKETKANGKIAVVVRRAAADAQRVRNTDSGSPGAYDAWIAGLCANDIYEGHADCVGHRGK